MQKCHVKLETLAHILGDCTHTKPSRIQRHDNIKEFIEKKLLDDVQRSNVVTTEATILAPDGETLKPDLLVKSSEGVFLVDVTVRQEDRGCLRRAMLEKISKYEPILPTVADLHAVAKSEILPVVVGTTGAMPRDTIYALSRLGIINKSNLKTISLMALRSSLEIYHAFMDYDGAT